MKPVDVQMEKFTEEGLDSDVSDKSLDFTNSLFAVQVTEFKATVTFGGVCDSSRKLSVKTHPVEEGGCGFTLDGVEFGVG